MNMPSMLPALLLIIIIFIFVSPNGAVGSPQFSAMFVFGDSIVDDGNNNNLNTRAKANFVPHGIDFNKGPTGRFCNGKTIIDFLVHLLGLPYLPVFTSTNTTGTNILDGVNYASAGAGILDESGRHLALQGFGLRKFVLAGVGPLGCIPSKLASGAAP
ncbi:hypothetical protein SO802_021538 [Lithocarpus litseifolius]|uniref:GDSL esterase/lipase n=1 Tax=Lithocarpus litseifolius TaxID=425828 RepID=A0AAW2CFG3_9ROSI